MSSTPVILVLGAGPRVGSAIATLFSSHGYKIALASRSGTNSTDASGILSLKADFSNPSTISPLFAAVKKEFHTAPNVVVYNAATLTQPPDKASSLSIPVDSFVSDLNVNTVSPYVAAQEAITGFATLPKEVKKTFIYTGNILNRAVFPVPFMLTLGVGKAASAHWIGLADGTYKEQGYRFFYADERKEDGSSIGLDINGPAHAEFFAELVKQEGSVPWSATFVKGKGYVEFK
ncbi:hypothetical protein B0J11DRAFT_520233 [Dendryphion nanum]|uniref:Short-chain dehydrogenase n=1 Tax=Dendryphion nanum TaxID=256645 RepID=A0A9P9E722_9PLEO|nr:hypothetical protein B0J11DRAFT_520233 [Dendryphion nanum]